jgi:hypothetical protein
MTSLKIFEILKDLFPYAMLMFFGKDAIRMLRETWEGVVNVTEDPATGQKQVKPEGADLLAQEIFSMLNDSTPQTNDAPVTINQPSGGMGLTINGQAGSPPSLHVTGGDVTMATAGNIAIGKSTSATSIGANITLSGNQIAIPPLGVIQLPATDYNPLNPGSLPTITLMTSAGPVPGQSYIGQVMGVAGGGGYTMQLAGVTGTVVAYPGQVQTGYVVPNGTWSVVVAVQGAADAPPTYYFQPFPYANQTISGPWQAPSTLHNAIVGLQNLGLFVDATTNSPPTISGPTQGLHGGGALTNLLIGLNNLGIIVNSTTDSPQVFGGGIQNFGTGGLLINMLIALNNLGITNATFTSAPPSISGSRAGNPALANLLTGLQSLNIILDATTP